MLLNSGPPFLSGFGKSRRRWHRVPRHEIKPIRESGIGDEKTRHGVVGDAFQVGLGEKVAGHCHANDAPQLMLGDVCALRELRECDGVVGRDEKEDAEV